MFIVPPKCFSLVTCRACSTCSTSRSRRSYLLAKARNASFSTASSIYSSSPPPPHGSSSKTYESSIVLIFILTFNTSCNRSHSIPICKFTVHVLVYCVIRTVQAMHIPMLQLLRYPDDSEMSEQFGRTLEWSSYKRDTYRSVIDSNARLQRAPHTSLSSPSMPAVSSTTSLTANTISPLSLARHCANTDQRAPPSSHVERQNGLRNKHYSEQQQKQQQQQQQQQQRENLKRLSLDVNLGPPQSSNNVLRAPFAQNLFIGRERSPRSEPESQLLLFDSHSTTI